MQVERERERERERGRERERERTKERERERKRKRERGFRYVDEVVDDHPFFFPLEYLDRVKVAFSQDMYVPCYFLFVKK